MTTLKIVIDVSNIQKRNLQWLYFGPKKLMVERLLHGCILRNERPMANGLVNITAAAMQVE